MTTTISNNALPPFAPAANGTGSGSAAAAGTSASHSDASGKVGDQVKLTDSALALREASRAHDDAVVDRPRVAQIRKALADGSYTVNPTRIAEKMLILDQQMHGAGRA